VAVVRAPELADQPVGALVSRLGADLGRILHAEIALVQLRLAVVLRALRDAGGILVASALLAVTGVGALGAGLILVVAWWIPVWVSAFAVGGTLLITALLLAATQTQAVRRDVREALAPMEDVRGH
jgi:hypothetical protein